MSDNAANFAPPKQAATAALELAHTRSLERHGAAALRALSGKPDAEYRANRLRVGHEAQGYAAPHLAVPFAESSLSGSRGIADSLALRLRHSDRALHAELAPKDPLARIFFDVFEQLRCESLADADMRDSALGILLYSVVHMVRSRLINTIDDEIAEGLIEATRANLSKIVGHELYAFKKERHCQRRYGEYAVVMAEKLAAMIDDDGDNNDTESVQERHSIVLHRWVSCIHRNV